MAIIQISKIQQRSGNLVNLPQLDEAQFGWANDTKQLFIGSTGNSTTDSENVEVLTSYSTAPLPPGGGNTQIQFNDGGVLKGIANFTITGGSNTLCTVSLTGNLIVGNIAGSNLITSNYFVGNGSLLTNVVAQTVSNAAQPNITSVGTLTSISVSGNANIGNIGTVGLITAVGNINGGNIVTSNAVMAGTLTISGISNLGNVGNIVINGGSNGQVLTTNGSGGLSWANGTGGSSNGGYYLHTQTIASTTWNVVHNLDRQYVAVEPVDSTGNSYTGRYDFPVINYINANALSMTWSSATNGYAAVVGGGTSSNGGGGNGNYGDSNVIALMASFGSNPINTNGNVTVKYLINSVANSVNAAGSSSTDATALGNTINIVTSVSSGQGVKLPTATAGMTIYITNTSANSLLVYPASGATINELATNEALTQSTKATLHYVAASSTQWYSVGATYA